jgi:homoserine dehydrogenase
MKNIRIVMLGYGNAGTAFKKLLESKGQEIKEKYNAKCEIIAIGTGSRGNLLEPKGISSMGILENTEYDIMIELTPLAIKTGQPAINHIETALCRGKHVITANKGPIAWDHRRLRDIAKKNGCMFLYETTVMDGTPVFNMVSENLEMCRVTEVRGILNSTTNYILEEMSKDRPYKDIIREGRERGFIEADASMDIEGYDAAAKLTALMNVLMDAGITPDDVSRKGIEDISLEDIKSARSKGKVIKLICRGTFSNGNIICKVAPEEIDKDGLYASIKGTSSVVSITTDLMGTVHVIEEEPEIEQTAYGIFGDLLKVVKEMHIV